MRITGAAVSSELYERSNDQFLQDAVLDSADVGEFLDELCRHAVQSLDGGTEVLCGITLLRSKKAVTVGSSSERARRLDEVQYAFDDGPCLTASRTQTTVEVPDLVQETRWPGYIGAISGHGMHSILAVPFDLQGEAKAALNLYSDRLGEFTGDALAAAAAYAAEASRSLRLALRIAEHSDTSANLKAALESRTVIDIAVGIIMAQSRCSQEAAFGFLKKASSHRNIKIREIAAQIVAGIGTGEPETHFVN